MIVRLAPIEMQYPPVKDDITLAINIPKTYTSDNGGAGGRSTGLGFTGIPLPNSHTNVCSVQNLGKFNVRLLRKQSVMFDMWSNFTNREGFHVIYEENSMWIPDIYANRQLKNLISMSLNRVTTTWVSKLAFDSAVSDHIIRIDAKPPAGDDTGPSPKAKDTVVVNYRGTLLNGVEFDSSYLAGREPAEFPLKRVIKGWTEGLQLMKEGAKFRFFIPPELAYGKRGAGIDIGPNETLIFEVELLKVWED